MKRTKKLTPEVHAKAEGFIANGYQRLLTFEVPGGGFSWFGQAPGQQDPHRLRPDGILRHGEGLRRGPASDRSAPSSGWRRSSRPDGSWKPDTHFINEGATNRYNSDVLRITAYLAWSLENTGYQGPAVEKARQFVEQHMTAKMDAYTLAVVANFAADYGKDRDFTRQAMQHLLDARTEKDEQAWWTRGRNRRLRPRRQRQRGDHRPGRAGAAQMGRRLRHGRARRSLYRVEEGRQRHLGHHASHHHGAARAAALHRKRRAPMCAARLESRSTASPWKSSTLTPENNDLLHQFVFNGGWTPAAPAASGFDFEGQGSAWPTRWWGAISCPGARSRPTSRSRSTWPTIARAWRRTISPRPPPRYE